MSSIYILFDSKSRRPYTGSTENLQRRLQEHRLKKPNHKLVYQETFETLHEAQAREKFLKTGNGRKWLKKKLSELGV